MPNDEQVKPLAKLLQLFGERPDKTVSPKGHQIALSDFPIAADEGHTERQRSGSNDPIRHVRDHIAFDLSHCLCDATVYRDFVKQRILSI